MAFQAGVRLTGNLLLQFLHQPGLANARLATHQHHLPHPLLDLHPALLEHGDFRRPSRQGREPPCERHRKAALGVAFPQHAVEGERGVVTTGVWCLVRLTHDVILHEPVGLCTEQHGLWQRLGVELLGCTDHAARDRRPPMAGVAQRIDYHPPGMDAEPDGQRPRCSALPRERQAGHHRDQGQTGPDGAQGRIFVGDGIAKVDEDFVTVVLRNIPGKGRNRLFTRLIEDLHEPLEGLGVLPLQPGRRDEAAAEDGQVAAAPAGVGV